MIPRFKQILLLAAVLLGATSGAFAAQNRKLQVLFFNYLDQSVLVGDVVISTDDVVSWTVFLDNHIDPHTGLSHKVDVGRQTISFTVTTYTLDDAFRVPPYQLQGDESEIYVVIDAFDHVELTAKIPGQEGYRILKPAASVESVASPALAPIPGADEHEEEGASADAVSSLASSAVTTLALYHEPLVNKYVAMAAPVEVAARRSSNASGSGDDMVLVDASAQAPVPDRSIPAGGAAVLEVSSQQQQKPAEVGLFWRLFGY